VEIITATTARPNPAWLGFVATAKARSNIHHYLKNLQHEEALELGRRMLDKALLDYDTSLREVGEERIGQLVTGYGADDLDRVLVDLGLGKRLAPLVARQLVTPAEAGHEAPEAGPGQPLIIRGTEGMVVNFGKCCRPLPGDAIIGLLTSGKGIVVHRSHCRNVRDKESERWLGVVWSDDIETEFPAEIRLDVNNQRGVLATVAATIAEADSNISHVSVDEREGNVTTMVFVVTARGRVHLARILRRLRNIPQVLRISRPG